MIKTKKLNQLALGISALTLGVSAQFAQAQDTFTASGPIAYAYHYNSTTGNYDYIYDGSFEAIVNHDSSTPLSYTYYDDYANYYRYGYSSWDNATQSIDVIAYDSNGVEVFRNTAILGNSNYYSYSQTYKQAYEYYGNYSQYEDHKYEQWYVYDYIYDSNVYRDDYAYAYWQDNDIDYSDEIANIEVYPVATDNTDWDYATVYSYHSGYDYNTSVSDYSYLSGTIAEITGGDTDGDGIPDGMDACIDSDLSNTVIVGDNDSKVTNTLLDNGCTLTDMIALIQADEEQHGKVVSGVAHFLNQMRDEGVLSGKEKGAIQSATAKSKPKKSK